MTRVGVTVALLSLIAVGAGPAAAASSRKPPVVRRAPAQRPAPKPVPVPVLVAPASPLGEERVPLLPVVPEPALMLDSMKPATVPNASMLLVTGKIAGDGGALVLLVDGAPVFMQQALGSGTSFRAEIGVSPGEHVLIARLTGGDEDAQHLLFAAFASGETQTLRITADRSSGSPVKLRLVPAASR